MELERDSLKGFAKLTKKGELQSKIDCKNEEIDLLKDDLSEIAKRYDYLNMQEFYCIYHKSYIAYAGYQFKISKWKAIYGAKARCNTLSKKMWKYQKDMANRQIQRSTQRIDNIIAFP